MKLLAIIPAILAGAVLLEAQTSPASSTRPTPSASDIAVAEVSDSQSRPVGQARFQQISSGVLMHLELKGVPAGTHALHVHEVGTCEAPSFESAGDHVSDAEKQHGFFNAMGPHAGDLPNVEVPADGHVTVEHLLGGLTLKGAHPLLDDDGASLVLHAAKDDYRTDPAGNSGDRIACGAIKAADAN